MRFLPILTFLLLVATALPAQNRITVPGTSISMIPPADFGPADGFFGFQQEGTGSSIVVMEFPEDYATMVGEMDEAAFASQGVVVTAKERFPVNGGTGTLFKGTQEQLGMTFAKRIVLFGNASLTVLLVGNFNADIPGLEGAILASLRTAQVAIESADPREALTFAIDPEGTKLQFGKALSGTAIYTVDGKVPTESADRTDFLVAPSLTRITNPDHEVVARTRLHQTPYVVSDEPEVRAVEIAGLAGYELIAHGRFRGSGAEALMHLTMLFDGDRYWALLGTSPDDSKANRAMFRKLAATFRPR